MAGDTVAGDLIQENRCAVCGRPVSLREDPERRDESLGVHLSASGQLPICPACQDDLYYEPVPR